MTRCGPRSFRGPCPPWPCQASSPCRAQPSGSHGEPPGVHRQVGGWPWASGWAGVPSPLSREASTRRRLLGRVLLLPSSPGSPPPALAPKCPRSPGLGSGPLLAQLGKSPPVAHP